MTEHAPQEIHSFCSTILDTSRLVTLSFTRPSLIELKYLILLLVISLASLSVCPEQASHLLQYVTLQNASFMCEVADHGLLHNKAKAQSPKYLSESIIKNPLYHDSRLAKHELANAREA
jgi:hypothetical protein